MAAAPATLTLNDIDAKAKEDFITIIHSQMEIIEELSANETLNDGTYLDLTNNLKKLYEFSDRLKKNAIYVVYDRHVRNARERPEVPKNYEMRMKYGCVPCEFCGRLIINTKSAISDHQKREICHRIRIEKRGAIFTKNGKRSDFEGFETAYHVLHDWCMKHIKAEKHRRTAPADIDWYTLTYGSN